MHRFAFKPFLAIAALTALGTTTRPAQAQLIAGDYTGSYNFSFVPPASFHIDSALTSANAAFGLNNAILTADATPLDPNAIHQAVSNGALTLTDGKGNQLLGVFDGMFLFDPATGTGQADFAGHFTGGAGQFSGVDAGQFGINALVTFTGPGTANVTGSLRGVAVPEPGSLAMIAASGLCGVGLLARRRQK